MSRVERGRGIPEAMENILVDGSNVQPRLAIPRPISSAVSIGTGGSLGAEGPIILTGGAVAIVGRPCRAPAALPGPVADRMAALRLGVLPVVDRADVRHLNGLVTQFDLLDARQILEEERHAERVLTLPRVRPTPTTSTAANASPR